MACSCCKQNRVHRAGLDKARWHTDCHCRSGRVNLDPVTIPQIRYVGGDYVRPLPSGVITSTHKLTFDSIRSRSDAYARSVTRSVADATLQGAYAAASCFTIRTISVRSASGASTTASAPKHSKACAAWWAGPTGRLTVRHPSSAASPIVAPAMA